jgi:hypothetical protein
MEGGNNDVAIDASAFAEDIYRWVRIENVVDASTASLFWRALSFMAERANKLFVYNIYNRIFNSVICG